MLERPYGWVALELNDPTFDSVNRAVAADLVRECEREGPIAAGIWMTRNFTAAQARQAVIETGSKLFVAEGEIPAQMLIPGDGPQGAVPAPNPQAQDWTDLAFRLKDLGIDCAVGTNWSPFQKYVRDNDRWILQPAPEFAKPLTDANWYVLPYVYPAETPTHSVAGAKAYAQHFPAWAGKEEPVLGTYCGQFGCFDLDSPVFNGKDACPGWSVWDAGEQF